MYRKFAEERESEGFYEGSIEYWAKSLEAARAAGDQAALGQACYRLGKAYTELGQPTRSVGLVSGVAMAGGITRNTGGAHTKLCLVKSSPLAMRIYNSAA